MHPLSSGLVCSSSLGETQLSSLQLFGEV